ncbi:MAG: WG repeat-containing protein [Clostridia bacterium]|nr:WG repeat-containing protein [Clostridia bacterium]
MKKIIALVLVLLSLPIVPIFAEEEAFVRDMGEYKIVAQRKRVVVPHEYGGPIYSIYNYGVTDKDGNIIIPQIYDVIYPQKEGRSAFVLNGNLGFFGEDWSIVIEPIYRNFSHSGDIGFEDGIACVAKQNENGTAKCGYIDINGNEVIDFIYDYAEPFENGSAKVGITENLYNYNTATKYGRIDKEGNITQPLKFGYATGSDYEYLWQEPLEVLLSENLVELNTRRYKNSDIEYPFINFLGYSYIPLTYYGCRMLGINCDWTPENGVVLSSGGKMAEDIVGENGMQEGVYEKATFYKGRLTINGKIYEYGDTAYPLIHFRNVVYIPVLWRQGMEELGIKYNYIGPEKMENSERGCMVFEINP